MSRYSKGSILRTLRLSKEVHDWIEERSKKNYRDFTLETYVVLQEAYQAGPGYKSKAEPKKNEPPVKAIRHDQPAPEKTKGKTMKEVMQNFAERQKEKGE